MKPSQGQSVAIGLLWALAAANLPAWAGDCPADRRWEQAVDVSTSAQGTTVTITRYQDGLYAKLETGEASKEMYQLNAAHRVYLTKGVTATSDGAYTRDFLSLDKFVWLPMILLSQKYAHPCGIPAKEAVDFEIPAQNPFGMPPGRVRGSAQHLTPDIITYTLALFAPDAKPEASPLQEYHGQWHGGDPQQRIPDDLPVLGWNVSIQAQGLKELTPFQNPNQTHHTLAALKTALAAWRPQQ